MRRYYIQDLSKPKIISFFTSRTGLTLRGRQSFPSAAARSPDLWLPDTLGRPALVVAACSRPKAKSQELLKALLSQKAQPEASIGWGWDLGGKCFVKWGGLVGVGVE